MKQQKRAGQIEGDSLPRCRENVTQGAKGVTGHAQFASGRGRLSSAADHGTACGFVVVGKDEAVVTGLLLNQVQRVLRETL